MPSARGGSKRSLSGGGTALFLSSLPDVAIAIASLHQVTIACMDAVGLADLEGATQAHRHAPDMDASCFEMRRYLSSDQIARRESSYAFLPQEIASWKA